MQAVASGSEALAALQAEPPDLALIDLGLPDMSGWEVLEAARAQQLAVPIVIMTASTLAADELMMPLARAPACSSPLSWTICWRVCAEHIRQR